MALRSRQFAAVFFPRWFVVAGVKRNLPGAIGLLFPDRHVAAGLYLRRPITILRSALVVAPGETHVAAGAHAASFRCPGELIIGGRPSCVRGDGGLSDDWS